MRKKLKKLYILKVGQTFENTKNRLGDFDDWVRNGITTKNITVETIDILKGEVLPSFSPTIHVIITGSHSMVTEEHHWSIAVEEWISQAVKYDIKILGICYGHQLLGKALGGKSDYNPKGKEIGTVKICTNPNVKEDPLFKDAPTDFKGNVTHLQSVLTLPEGAEVLGYNSHDEHQIVRYGQNIWGVQFHPEFDTQIMKAYIEEQKKDLLELGFRPEKLLENVTETTYAHSIIDQFVRL